MLNDKQLEKYLKLEAKLRRANNKLNRVCNRSMSREEEGFTEMLKAEQAVYDLQDEMSAMITISNT